MHNWVTRAEAGLPSNTFFARLYSDIRTYYCLNCGVNITSGRVVPPPDAMIDTGKTVLKSCEEVIANKIMES